MPITESKLKSGTLTLDSLPFATQATNVRLVPNVEEQGDPVEVLSGDELGADETTRWTLVIEAIQDFDDPAGFIAFCFENAGLSVPFTWEPNNTTGTGDLAPTSFSGSVKIRAAEIGGPVNTRNTAEVEMPCIGAVTPAWAS